MGSAGDSESQRPKKRAADRLMPKLYAELRKIAEHHFRRPGAENSLQPTALVHEAYLRLAEHAESAIEGRTHFLAIAATAMRQIMIDHARRRSATKRGGGSPRVTLSGAKVPSPKHEVDLLELNDALEHLAKLDERKAKVVELRLFGGLTIKETAEVLEISHMTVSTDWRVASAWLATEFES